MAEQRVGIGGLGGRAAESFLVVPDGYLSAVTALDDRDIHWLAGLFEGEGSFLAGPPSAPCVPAARVEMTDEDVVRRIGLLLNRAVSANKPRQAGHKPSFSVMVKGVAAVEFMAKIKPLMGERRAAAIGRAIATSAKAAAIGRVLSYAQTRAIVAARAAGESADSVAANYGISKSMVYKIASGIRRASSPLQPQAATWSEDHALCWLAGLLEGEGCFLLIDKGGHRRASIDLSMTDRDVVERAAKLMGARSVYAVESRRPTWKPCYVIRLSGAPARRVMRAVLPMMGDRRATKIRLILGEAPSTTSP